MTGKKYLLILEILFLLTPTLMLLARNTLTFDDNLELIVTSIIVVVILIVAVYLFSKVRKCLDEK